MFTGGPLHNRLSRGLIRGLIRGHCEQRSEAGPSVDNMHVFAW